MLQKQVTFQTILSEMTILSQRRWRCRETGSYNLKKSWLLLTNRSIF